MNINELYKNLHGSFGSYIRLMDIDKQDQVVIDEITKYMHCDQEKIKNDVIKVAEYLECDSNDIYYHGGFIPVSYIKNCMQVDLNSFELQILDFLQVKERIKAINQQYKEYLEKKNFRSLLFFIDKKFRFQCYKEVYDLIPNDQKYEVFIDIYTSSEYGFGTLDREFLNDILSYKTTKVSLKDIGLDKFDKNGNLTIYRGVGSESTSIDKAYSWTTNANVALFFATRFSSNSKIYQAKVNKSNIVEYIDNRNEQEIIVMPENLIDIKELNFLGLNEIMEEYQSLGLIDYYHSYVTALEEDYFREPDSIHGMLHAKRVLLLSLIIGMMNDLSEDEIDILAKAALYHDIGRKNDYEDKEHGRDSYNKATDYGLIDDNELAEDKTLQYIIEQHCIDDKEAFKNVSKYRVGNEIQAVNLLKLFKDADNLDRVRIRDLDISYIRNEESKKLPLVAYQLLKGIK